jgi:D-glycero-alpha-D-manno-heptose-7-phosphate kinase
MLFFTGIVRTAAVVASTYGDGPEQRKSLRNTTRLVDEALELLGSEKELVGFGELLDQGWNEKRKLSNNVSTQQLDRFYSRGCEAGAVGGKIAGAGGGGMLLLYVPVEKQNDVRVALSELLLIPIKLETAGCQVIFFSESQDRLSSGAQ